MAGSLTLRLVPFRGSRPLDWLTLGRIQLAGINDAFKQLETGEVARTVIAFWGGTRRSDLSNAAVVRA